MLATYDVTTVNALIAAVSALSGIVLTGIVAAITNLLQNNAARKFSAQQQLRGLAVKLALEQWRYDGPLRDQMRDRLHTNWQKEHPHDPLPQIPAVLLSDVVLEMTRLLENIPAKNQPQK